ncbi:hypothetical protein J7E88_17695 [Streptomyces sp. ISL-10]|nr:hypothetical protein [Streptomyces sp. ISL-10]MBT2367089.1 hypothetical protein [Streptomyces sp. ISL-10]
MTSPASWSVGSTLPTLPLFARLSTRGEASSWTVTPQWVTFTAHAPAA